MKATSLFALLTRAHLNLFTVFVHYQKYIDIDKKLFDVVYSGSGDSFCSAYKINYSFIEKSAIFYHNMFVIYYTTFLNP